MQYDLHDLLSESHLNIVFNENGLNYRIFTDLNWNDNFTYKLLKSVIVYRRFDLNRNDCIIYDDDVLWLH